MPWSTNRQPTTPHISLRDSQTVGPVHRPTFLSTTASREPSRTRSRQLSQGSARDHSSRMTPRAVAVPRLEFADVVRAKFASSFGRRREAPCRLRLASVRSVQIATSPRIERSAWVSATDITYYSDETYRESIRFWRALCTSMRSLRKDRESTTRPRSHPDDRSCLQDSHAPPRRRVRCRRGVARSFSWARRGAGDPGGGSCDRPSAGEKVSRGRRSP